MPEIWIAQVNFWDLVATREPIPLVVMVFLIAFSLFSWTIIFSKWTMFRKCTAANRQFLRAFRKADSLASVMPIAQQHADAPLSAVFDFGYSEVSRQVHARGKITNAVAVERTLQLGVGEEIAQLERNMSWLATTATVTPFIGLFGTVWGIIGAFQALGLTGSTSMRTVAPGIANALIATALGLGAAIPAAVFYNHFGNIIKEMTARMEDFSLEFLNLTERTFEG
ncbi:MAG: MotA/TolQ/ExbB proton channel family protein [Bryobacteraceae bacterium]